MGIGVGILLIVIGLILLLDVIEDYPDAITNVIDVDTLGWICLIVGILACLCMYFGVGRGGLSPCRYVCCRVVRLLLS